jgi:hypothetical protein
MASAIYYSEMYVWYSYMTSMSKVTLWLCVLESVLWFPPNGGNYQNLVETNKFWWKLFLVSTGWWKLSGFGGM